MANQNERKSMQIQFQMEALRNEIAYEERNIARLRERRAEIEGRKVIDEARKQRFLRRLDAEIDTSLRMKAMAEANLEGLGGCHA